MIGRTPHTPAIALVAICLATMTTVHADPTCESLEEWVPGDVVAYARIDGLGRRTEGFLESKLRRDFEATGLGRALMANEKYAAFLERLADFEETAGRGALDLLDDLFGTEVVVSVRLTFIGVPEVLLLSRATSSDGIVRSRAALEKVAKMYLGDLPPTKKGDHRGRLIESLGDGHFTTIGEVIAVSNSRGMIESVIDVAEGKKLRSVRKSSVFAKVAPKARESLFIHVAVRPRFIPGFKIPEQMNNPVGSLLLGGLSGALRVSEAASLSIDVEKEGVIVRVASVPDGRGIDERYDAFFPVKMSSGLRSRLRARGVLGLVQLHRDLGRWWERAEELLEPRAVGDLTEFAGNMSIFFGGKSFQDEVLPELGETITFVAMNQSYEQLGVRPSPTVPALAVMFDLRNARAFGRSLKVAFNTIIGFINIGLMQQEKDAPTMLILPKLVGKTECYTVDMGLAPAGEKLPGIEYNFTPSLAIVGSRVILSSSYELLEVLVSELEKDGDSKQSGDSRKGKTVVAKPARDRVLIDASAVHGIVSENRDFLASNNMVEKGIDLQEARGEIDSILELVSFLRDLEIVSFRSGEKVHLNFHLRLDADRQSGSGRSARTASSGE